MSILEGTHTGIPIGTWAFIVGRNADLDQFILYPAIF